MYHALYRAFRPEVFDEVLGQEHIVRILKNQIANNSTSHAYLLCGTRGTGKTTTARLLAKGLNCLSEGDRPCGECANCKAIRDGKFIDVIEIDAASNNGVDNIRELRESVNYPPAVGRNKVYIIDEVHMLSQGAFNALLKTLEEPPAYVTFVLATTEVVKLPATILSRCMRLDFKRVPEKILIEGMQEICHKIGVKAHRDALGVIAANADGSVRDGLSILDQCISGGREEITRGDVLDFLGASGDEVFITLTDMVLEHQVSEAMVYLAEVLSEGKESHQFVKDWVNHYRNLLIVRHVREPQRILNMSLENIERVAQQARRMSIDDINNGILELSKTMGEMKFSTQPRILLELAMVKLCGVKAAPVVEFIPPAVEMPREIKRPKEAETSIAEDDAVEVISVQEISPEHEQKPQEEVSQGLNAQEAEADSNHGVQGEDQGCDAPEAEAGQNRKVLQETDAAYLDRLWQNVCAKAAETAGSATMFRTGISLVSVDEYEFGVVANSSWIKDSAINNRDLIEGLMAENLGRKVSMKILDEAPEPAAERPIEEIAKNASEIINAEVEIE